MIPTSFPTREEIARLSAGMLLEIGAVDFRPEDPFTNGYVVVFRMLAGS